MSFIFNALPKIKSFAKAIIIIGNFILEAYSLASKAYFSGRGAFPSNAA